MMDERQWLSSNRPQEMLDYLLGKRPNYEDAEAWGRKPIATDRKLDLLAQAIYEVTGDDSPGAYAYLLKAKPPSPQWGKWPIDNPTRSLCGSIIRSGNQQIVCTILRLIFGNQFRPISVETSPGTWLVSTVNGTGELTYAQRTNPDVLAVAAGIYNNRDASGFGELWDCLETAGCDSEEIRRALAWQQRCGKCLGSGKVYGLGEKQIPYTAGVAKLAETIKSYFKAEVHPCQACNGTGWLPIPGEPVMARGAWFIDLLLGKE